MNRIARTLAWLLPLVMLLGCNRFEQEKNDVRVKFKKVLPTHLRESVVNLEAPEGYKDFTEVKYGKTIVRVPRCPSPEDRTSPAVLLKYDRFNVVVRAPEDNDSGLDGLDPVWGSTDYDRYRAIYAISDRDMTAAKTPEQLAHVVAGLHLKGMIMNSRSEERLEAFQSPSLRGFILGRAKVAGVVYQCFPRNEPDGRETMILISPHEGEVLTDAECEKFIAATTITTAP